MAGNDGSVAARRALEALRGLDGVRDARPAGIDRFLWSADVLDDLARIAARLGHVVEDVSGEEGPAVRAAADALSTAIVAHRNSLLRHGLGRRDRDTTPARRTTSGAVDQVRSRRATPA